MALSLSTAAARLSRRWRSAFTAPGARSFWMGGSIAVAILLIYGRALRGGFVWDDDSWTLRLVDLLRDGAGLRAIWFRPTAMQQYYPLTGTTFWLDYHLWRFWPVPYHLENVSLHILATLLFARVLGRLQVRGAWLAAALFGLHPMMVESVAWITERKNVLSLPLALGAFLAYLRYVRAREPAADVAAAPPNGRAGPSYGLALLLFAGALLAKTTVCCLPAALLLVLWWRRGRLRWREDVTPVLPFFVLALGMCAVTGWLEREHVGAQGSDYALSFVERVLIAGRAFWFYLGKLVWPTNLCFVYPRWQPSASSWTDWLYPVTAVGALLGLWLLRRRIGRGPVTALLFFAGALLPLLGFVNVYFMRYAFVCDHWAYLPSLGLMALLGSGLHRVGEKFGTAPWSRLAVGALLLTLAVLTSRQTEMYADAESLWRATIERNPSGWLAYSSLGNLLFRRGRTNEAIANFEQAIRLKPDLAEAYTSLGSALGSKGELDAAIAKLREAIRLKPDYAEAHYDLGVALQQKGEGEQAIAELREALRLKPDLATARRLLERTLRRDRRRGSL